MTPETKEVMDKRIAHREQIFIKASVMLEPIVEQHGIADHRDGGSAIFVSAPMVTKIDQHLDHIMRVADWLMIREE